MQGNRNLSPQSDFSIQRDVIVRPRQFHNGAVCQRSYGHCLRYGTVKKEQKDAVMSFFNDVFVALPTGYGKLFNGIKQDFKILLCFFVPQHKHNDSLLLFYLYNVVARESRRRSSFIGFLNPRICAVILHELMLRMSPDSFPTRTKLGGGVWLARLPSRLNRDGLYQIFLRLTMLH